MINDINFIVANILKLEKKYALYFRDKDYKIRNCVKVILSEPVSIHLINHVLPFEIACDIEEMFWREPDKIDDLSQIMLDIKQEAQRAQKLRANCYNLCAGLTETCRQRQSIFARIRNYQD
ncbi:hypothetical protein ACPPVU_08995 [Mucilaginibacter sp. McL0603]|uniref:hypothetical protein n=1 Tax=Mucilaginibacter sp. McL0603 TaxID=3415670 RepID=UPI003CED9166